MDHSVLFFFLRKQCTLIDIPLYELYYVDGKVYLKILY